MIRDDCIEEVDLVVEIQVAAVMHAPGRCIHQDGVHGGVSTAVLTCIELHELQHNEALCIRSFVYYPSVYNEHFHLYCRCPLEEEQLWFAFVLISPSTMC